MLHTADDRLRIQLEQKLTCHGVRPPCKVTVTVSNGVVTLSGTVQYDHQKRAILHACRATSGVKRVVDNLHVPPPKPAWGANKNATQTPTTGDKGHHVAS